MRENEYTAEEVAKILQEKGDCNISRRTVNYYAFEKYMFELQKTGKKCFTEAEIDKISAIRLLQNYTTYTLEQIKGIINSKSLHEINAMCAEKLKLIPGDATPTAAENTKTIKVDDDITLVVNSKANKDKVRKVISQIKNIF